MNVFFSSEVNTNPVGIKENKTDYSGGIVLKSPANKTEGMDAMWTIEIGELCPLEMLLS